MNPRDKLAVRVSWFALVGFVTFVVLLAMLLVVNPMSELQWERYTYLLTGVETITFTAVGWIFGKEVHREQAQRAEAQATQAREEVTGAREQAAREKMKAQAYVEHMKFHAEADRVLAQKLMAQSKQDSNGSFAPDESELILAQNILKECDEIDELSKRMYPEVAQ